MANCECMAGCPFFNDRMKEKPATAESYKRTFCQGEFSNCARYLVFSTLGKPQVPPDMFPNQQDRAKRLLSEAGR